ncbi:hypothetical protein K502DRAFT_326679 [Neoconidiobolus thromboides FSU 785]|nr:hypothetical protein K502DRAFT_326679 [Neoconidiobolus thromboides FSU 785]
MAQCLGYDISDTLFDKINIMDLRYNELLRGRSIWKTLHFTYLVLSSCIPNIPFIKFQTKEPLCIPDGPNRSTDVDEIGYKAIDELPYLFVKDYTEVTIKIASHIQKVKENYERRNDYSDIPINALLLPQNEFIICFTTLLNLIQDQKLIRDECDYTQKELDEKTNDYEFNFKRYLKVLIQHVIVQLYYPFATVYPQPVRFTKSKLKLLFYYSNQVITYCLNRGLDRKLDHSSFSKNSQFDSKYQLQSNVCTPFYYQITYSFFTLVNLIHQSNNLSKADVTMVDEAKAKCVLLVKELYSVSKANNKRYAKDSTNALNQIKRCIHRFELPVDLIQEIAMYLN